MSIKKSDAVSPPKQNAAPSSKVRSSGSGRIAASARIATNSACPPPPKPVTPNTRSPTAKVVTPAPTSATVPAKLTPGIGLRGPKSPLTSLINGP